MYGLQNILTEQGLNVEQQCVVLELINSAKLLDTLSLLASLGSCEFSQDETNRIIQATLNAIYNQTGKFDPVNLLNALKTEETHLKEKTKRWFDQMVKSAFIEHREVVRQFITPAMLLAFTPRSPIPSHNRYDTIIVLDSATQAIMDGLDYIKYFLDTNQITCANILIPQTLTPQTTNKAGCTAALRAHLPSYLQMNGLQSRVKSDAFLSQAALGYYLVELYLNQQNTPPQTLGIYQAYALMRSNRVLIVTTEDNIIATNNTVANVYEVLPGCKIATEVIYTLQKKELTNDDLLTLLIKQFDHDDTPGQPLTSTANDMSAAAAAAAAAPTHSATAPTSSTKDGTTVTSQGDNTSMSTLRSSAIARPRVPVNAINHHGASAGGLIAAGIAAVGFFAYANSETTTSAATTAFEAFKEFTRSALRTYLG